MRSNAGQDVDRGVHAGPREGAAGMKLAIMQPYFFPYLGYFQLIAAVDRFVFYDDVAFIKQGWINRNRILVNGEPHLFSVPLRGQDSFVAINRTEVDPDQFPRWRRKFLRTLAHGYADSPRLASMVALVKDVLQAAPEGMAALAECSVRACCRYLGIGTVLEVSSRDHPASGPAGSGLRGTDRIFAICRETGASEYVNPPGGRDLYDRRDFERAGLSLSFLEPRLEPYPQSRPGAAFVPGLSILDVLLRLDRDDARAAVLSCRAG